MLKMDEKMEWLNQSLHNFIFFNSFVESISLVKGNFMTFLVKKSRCYDISIFENEYIC